MRVRFLTLSLLIFNLTIANVHAEPNKLCMNNSLSHFRLRPGFEKLPSNELDYCTVQLPHIPELLQTLITHMGDLHRKVAAYFGMLPHQLFPKGIDATFTPSQMGVDYYAEGGWISLSAFPDWNGEPMDDSAYTHELGHLFLESPAIAKFITYGGFGARTAWNSPLTIEGFSDTLALLLTGKTAVYPSLSECFTKTIRGPFTGGEIGFDGRSKFFARPYSFIEQYNECCVKEWIGAVLPMDQHTDSICKSMKKQLDEIGIENEDHNRDSQSESDPFNPEQCFDPSTHQFIDKNCGPYSTGSPFSHFLYSLSQSIGSQPFAEIILNSIKKIGSSKAKMDHYTCKMSSSSDYDAIEVKVKREIPFFVSNIRDALSSSEKKTFDELWYKYGMSTGMKLDDLYNQHVVAASQAGFWMYLHLKMNPLFRYRNRSCIGIGRPNIEEFSKLPGCGIICHRIIQ